MTVVTSVPLSSPSKWSRWRKCAVVARYEYSMQVRRPALWLVIVALVAGLRSFRPWPASLDISTTALSPLIGDRAIDFMMLTPIGVGILLADPRPQGGASRPARHAWSHANRHRSPLVGQSPRGPLPQLSPPWRFVRPSSSSTWLPNEERQ